jgi:hypothetical protein
MAEEKISEATGKMTTMAGDISSKASGQWDKLENIFEDRVAKALNKLGVPSAKDIDVLIARIDELNRKLWRRRANAKAPPAKASKPAAKPLPSPRPSARRPQDGMTLARRFTQRALRRPFLRAFDLLQRSIANRSTLLHRPHEFRAKSPPASAWPWPAAARWAPSTRSARCARWTNPWTAWT